MHLYVHIPFCHEICPYCSFYKHKPGSVAQAEFIQALLTELDWHLAQGQLAPFTTIYLGGGTPSLLSTQHLTDLLTGLDARIPFASLQEVTMEANPSTFKLAKAQRMRALGVTRVSLGVQSLDAAQLQVLGRDHTPASAIDSYALLRQAQIPEVNLDLMFSTPGQSVDSWRSTLDQAISLQPDHLSCYNLTYEEDTDYFQKFLAGDYADVPETNEEYFYLADTLLTQAGYTHYETSNYARPGYESQHNMGYWRGNDYLGIGPSAVGCIARRRYQNLADTAGYITRIQQLGHAMDSHEQLDPDAWRIERLALELRTRQGISPQWIAPTDPTLLINNGLLEHHNGNLRTTKQGSSLVDSIVEFLI